MSETRICPFCGKETDKFIMFRGDIVGCRYCGISKKQTNADRIRAMTDEELAEYLDGVCHDLWQMFVKDPQKVWLDWLRKEAKE